MQRQSIRAKLFACVGVIVGLSALASIYFLVSLWGLRTELRHDIVGASVRLDQARRIQVAVATMRMSYRGITLFALQNISDQFDRSCSTFLSGANDMQEAIRELKAGELTPAEQENVKRIEDGLRAWMGRFPEFKQLSRDGHAIDASRLTLKYVTPVMDTILKTSTELGRGSAQRQETALQIVENRIAMWQMFTAIFLAAVAVVGAMGSFIAVRLTKSLSSIEESVASGANHIAQAAAQLSSASEAMAQGASEQAAAIEQTSASAEEINTMAHRNMENTQTAAGTVARSSKTFGETNDALVQMVAAMAEINRSSEQISSIIKMIDGIAFQTNILALNAAVEAARAGEAGLGFAVVAEEVRNLAQRCAQAARETAALVDQSVARTKAGQLSVDQVASAFRSVGADAQKLKSLVDDVHTGSNEQARGLEQVGKAILQIEQVTQKTAATSQETAVAAKQLSRQSESMKQVVKQLSVLVNGDSADRAEIHHSPA